MRDSVWRPLKVGLAEILLQNWYLGSSGNGGLGAEARRQLLTTRSKEGTIIIINGKVKVAARSPDPLRAMEMVNKMSHACG